MTAPTPDVRIRPPLLWRLAAVASTAVTALIFLLEQRIGVCAAVIVAGDVVAAVRAWLVEVRGTVDGRLLLRNPVHTQQLHRHDLDSAMVAPTRGRHAGLWAVHLVLRDGTRVPVLATGAVVRWPSSVTRRLDRQAEELDAWIRAGRPPRRWQESPRHALDASTDLYSDR